MQSGVSVQCLSLDYDACKNFRIYLLIGRIEFFELLAINAFDKVMFQQD